MRLSLFALVLAATSAAAEERATFALVIGVNKAADANLKPLKYADDDAARYFDFFRLLGAHTTVLARLDANTTRLHPQAAAEAREPTRAQLGLALEELGTGIARAQKRGLKTVLYVAYAGHGNVRDGEGYITLEDAELTGQVLNAELLPKVPADTVHLIIDACQSYFLAYGRGPGGERRAVSSFGTQVGFGPKVGLLLSTGSSRESHEWEAFQAGIFSHEIRSGLYGAADVDGDGEVSYREIAAFVENANAAIPNERFRPDLFARPPAGSSALVDLRRALERRLEIDGTLGSHYSVEDARGVRVADFNNAVGQASSLLRPLGNGPLFVRRVSDDREYTIPEAVPVVKLALLGSRSPRVLERGAAHEAFTNLFKTPFSNARAAQYEFKLPLVLEQTPSIPVRQWVGGSALALGAASISVGIWQTVSASQLRALSTTTAESQRDANARNLRIGDQNRNAVVLYSVGGAALATGLIALFWPDDQPALSVAATLDGAAFAFEGSF